MMQSLPILILVTVYLLGLTLLTRRLLSSPRMAPGLGHPAILVAALGAYTGCLGHFATLDLAWEYGFGYLAYYLGATGAFLLAPVLLYPMFRVARSYQLHSLPDLMAFRYRSQTAGTLATLVSLTGAALLMGLLLQVSDHALRQVTGGQPGPLPLLVLLGLGLFGGILLDPGRNKASPSPVLPLLALQNLVMLVLVLGLGAVLLLQQFGSFAALDEWIIADAQRISAMDRHLEEDPWRALLLLFFGSVMVWPAIFHLIISENRQTAALFRASWGFPLYLLLFSLPIPLMIWSALRLGLPSSPDMYFISLAQSMNHPWFTTLMTVLPLASGVLLAIISVQSLAGMTLNHVLLPLLRTPTQPDIYRWLNRWRANAAMLAALLGWVAYIALPPDISPSEGLILAFSLLVQLLPGLLALIYWPQGNRIGYIAGVTAGTVLWTLLLLMPSILGIDPLHLAGLTDSPLVPSRDWHQALLLTLTANTGLFALLSLVIPASRDEVATAQACSVDTLLESPSRELTVASPRDIIDKLASSLGQNAALQEVRRAMQQLGIQDGDFRSVTLRRLRNQIEVNLSGLLGPQQARSIVQKALDERAPAASGHRDLYLLESRLEDYHSRLRGLAAELDQLRRYHRQILLQLPIPACSLSDQHEVLMWNHAMETLTGIREEEIFGAPLSVLPQPWAALLGEFSLGDTPHLSKQKVFLKSQPLWVNLHKAVLEPLTDGASGQVILVEDYTETQRLEEELMHSERLASVGRLAAGVAHEIGNPVTGIACLAQNLKLMTDDPEILDTSRQVIEQTRRISRIVQSLMNFSRSGNHAQPSQYHPVRVRYCVEEAVHLLRLAPGSVSIAFVDEVPEDLYVVGDDQRLLQVFVNLLNNARDASRDGDIVTIRGQRQGNVAVIDVEDVGCGIPDDFRDRIFEPFFTTKGPDRGSGLGLALVYGIIEEHFGHIRVESPITPEGQGTRFTVELPVAPEDINEP